MLDRQKPVNIFSQSDDSKAFGMVIAIFEQLVEDLENELMKTGNSPEGVRLPENLDFSHRQYLQNKKVNIGGRVTKMFTFVGPNNIRLHGASVPQTMIGHSGFVLIEIEGVETFLPITCIGEATNANEWCITVRYDSTGEQGQLSPVFDEIVVFQSGYTIATTDIIGSKLEAMINHRCSQNSAASDQAGNTQDLNIRSSAYRFRLKKNRMHPLMWEHRAVKSSRWVEFSKRQSWGDFSINALLNNTVNLIGHLIWSKLGGRHVKRYTGGATSISCTLSETDVNHALLPLLDVAGFVESKGQRFEQNNPGTGGRLYTNRTTTEFGRHVDSKVGYEFETTDLKVVMSLFPVQIMFDNHQPLQRLDYEHHCNPRLLRVNELRELALRVCPVEQCMRRTYRGTQVFHSKKTLISLIERMLIRNAYMGGETHGLVSALRGVIACPADETSRSQRFIITLLRKCGGTQYAVRVFFFTAGIRRVVQADGNDIWIPLNDDQ